MLHLPTEVGIASAIWLEAPGSPVEAGALLGLDHHVEPDRIRGCALWPVRRRSHTIAAAGARRRGGAGRSACCTSLALRPTSAHRGTTPSKLRTLVGLLGRRRRAGIGDLVARLVRHVASVDRRHSCRSDVEAEGGCHRRSPTSTTNVVIADFAGRECLGVPRGGATRCDGRRRIATEWSVVTCDGPQPAPEAARPAHEPNQEPP